MSLLVYLPLLLPALAAAAARPLAARLEPCRATWLLTVATVVLAVCSMAALALLVAAAAARSPFVASLGHYSQPVVRRGDATSAVTGAVAAVLLTGAAVAVAVMIRRRARALAESYRRSARLDPDGVVVLPGTAIEAYALPGWPGRIVVSAGLLGALDAGGRAALLAHERAHLAARHHLFTTVAHLAAAANPLLLPVARTVDYTVERWADEHAARFTGDRHLVAATIARVALLATPSPRPLAGAALGIVRPVSPRVSLAWAGPVPRRVAALLAPLPPRRTWLLAAAALIVVLAGASALEAARDLHTLLDLARGAG
jgi:beta-lactamase regulating signal transducer with metallopeptidase domain